MIPVAEALRGKRNGGRKILSIFVTAGIPSPASTPGLVRELAEAGADAVEIGVPFSDPMADGPVIQASSARALAMGVTPAGVLSMVREIRKITDVPVILMGYANPFLSYGMEAFVRDASSAGAGGMIVPDLPPGESGSFRSAAAAGGLAPIFLVAPTTPVERISAIDEISGGFVYAVSTLGVTGERDRLPEGAHAFLGRARDRVKRNLLLAGFGVSGPDSALALAGHCDGVIVGSAVVSRLSSGGTPHASIRAASEFTASLRSALDA
jgi:tryptophan synthase alpha chain